MHGAKQFLEVSHIRYFTANFKIILINSNFLFSALENLLCQEEGGRHSSKESRVPLLAPCERPAIRVPKLQKIVRRRPDEKVERRRQVN